MELLNKYFKFTIFSLIPADEDIVFCFYTRHLTTLHILANPPP